MPEKTIRIEKGARNVLNSYLSRKEPKANCSEKLYERYSTVPSFKSIFDVMFRELHKNR